MLRFRPVLALPSSKAFLFPQYTPRKNPIKPTLLYVSRAYALVTER